ncbi:LacI family DNA-binding transcriptional regulator [Promicromonospora vindobonensis]|uniref:LacI family DNA-binding transcriptional regulator n=1 Tax=Promicromonospora vindobonensis TaxID=195748 RepID=A0ABW5VRL2_9MICO
MVPTSRPNDPELSDFPTRSRRPTIVDVARVAGVSTAVVSYTLNGRRGVSATTRERVLRVADELGWRPATAARSLRSGPAAAALVVVHDQPFGTRAAFPLDLVAGALQTLGPDTLTLAVHVAGSPADAAQLMDRWWTERRYAAFVVTGVRVDDARLAALRTLPAPTVVVGAAVDNAPGTWQQVVLDDGDAFAQVGSFLAGLGHRRIAMVAGSERLVAPARRAAALEAALVGQGIELRTVAGDGPERASAALRPLLSAADRPTAIVTDDDATAGLVLDVARRLGLGVPWDLSVVAGTDSPACYLTTPSLTAVPYPVEELGRATGRALRAVLGAVTSRRAVGVDPAEGAAPPSGTVSVGRLVVRGSTAPPAGG